MVSDPTVAVAIVTSLRGIYDPRYSIEVITRYLRDDRYVRQERLQFPTPVRLHIKLDCSRDILCQRFPYSFHVEHRLEIPRLTSLAKRHEYLLPALVTACAPATVFRITDVGQAVITYRFPIAVGGYVHCIANDNDVKVRGFDDGK